MEVKNVKESQPKNSVKKDTMNGSSKNHLEKNNVEIELKQNQGTSSRNRHYSLSEEQEDRLLADDEEDLDVIDCYYDGELDSDGEISPVPKQVNITSKVFTEMEELESHPNSPVHESHTEHSKETNFEAGQDLRNLNDGSTKNFEVSKVSIVGMPSEVPMVKIPFPSEVPMLDIHVDTDTLKTINSDDDSLSITPCIEIETNPATTDFETICVEELPERARPTENYCFIPDISLRVKTEDEKERILAEPLVKQMVITEVYIDEDIDVGREGMGSQESLNLEIDHLVNKASELVNHDAPDRSECDAKPGTDAKLCIDYSLDGESDSNAQQEDPAVLQLKLDLYQNIGEMDYEPEEDDRGIEKFIMLDGIKQERVTPVKKRVERTQIAAKDIPTIDLISTDEELEGADIVYYKPDKRRKRKSTECSNKSHEHKLMLGEEHRSPERILSQQSEPINSEAISHDTAENLNSKYSDRVMNLRKRNVTILPEMTMITSVKKPRSCGKKSPSKNPSRNKKRIDPSMMGYNRRRKSTSRSASKCSMLSNGSTTCSSMMDDEMIMEENEDFIDIKLPSTNVENNYESKCNEAAEPCSPINTPPEKNDQDLDKNDICTKEIEPSVSITAPTSDLALSDMLESYFEVEVEKPSNVVAFHSMSSEEKIIMDTLFADCNTPNSHQLINNMPLGPLDTILDDGKALNLNTPNALIGTDSYVINIPLPETNELSETTSPPECSEETVVQDGVDGSVSEVKRVHFNVVQNYDKYPIPTLHSNKQNSAAKQTKMINALPRGKGNRKKGESDEDFEPPGWKTKKVRRRRKKTTSISSQPEESATASAKSTEDADDQKSKPQKSMVEATDDQPPKADSGYKSMPSLEEDLALTSSSESSQCSVIDKGSNAQKDCQLSNGNKSKEKAPNKNLQESASVPKASKESKKSSSTSVSSNTKTGKKRGRPPAQKDTTIYDFFCPTSGKSKGNCTASCCELPNKDGSLKLKISKKWLSKKVSEDNGQPAKSASGNKSKKKRRILSSSDDESSMTISETTTTPSECTITDGMLSCTSSFTPMESVEELVIETTKKEEILPDKEKDILDKSKTPKCIPEKVKLDKLQVILSPLTDEKIRKINTPKKKVRPLNKASQTEICGLTWSIELGQINFQSEYFEKLRTLLNNNDSKDSGQSGPKAPGKETSPNEFVPNARLLDQKLESKEISAFSGNQMPSREALQFNSVDVSENLLFQKRVDDVQIVAPKTIDRVERNQLDNAVKSIRCNFRIPKITKQPSTSPQTVTSSTSSQGLENIAKDRNLTATSGYTNASEENPLTDDLTISAETNRTASSDYPSYGDELEPSYRPSANASCLIGPSSRSELRTDIITQSDIELPSNQTGSPSNSSSLSFCSSFLSRRNSEQPTNESNNKANLQSLDTRPILPDRSEMVGQFKRTIRNDQAQTQPTMNNRQTSSQQLSLFQMMAGNSGEPSFNVQQPTINPFSGFADNGPVPSAYNVPLKPCGMPVNRGYSAFPDVNQNYSSLFGGMAGGINPLNNFMAMMWEQFQQQQQTHIFQQQQQTHMFQQQPQTHPMRNAGHFGQPQSSAQLFPQIGPMRSKTGPSPEQKPDMGARPRPENFEMISYLFGCYDFLSDQCNKPNCKYDHYLASQDDVLRKLGTQNKDFIMCTYRFVASRDDLFIKYFPVFTSAMAQNNMRHQLVTTIPDCELPRRPIHYYRYIVEGLQLSGTNPVQAVQILIEKHVKKSFNQINVIIELVLETGAKGVVNFLRWLEEVLLVRDYKFETKSVNRLLGLCLEYDRPPHEMIKLVVKLILRILPGEESSLDYNTLLTFVTKVGQIPEFVLDVSQIVQKFAKQVVEV
ncbi:uncharacterized protein LOC129754201 isoform X2 [Uranotaenia lowii]|uniref:uncharacterized protein LOC129754201 isoform X2 n=1 Tax=Uranotaenia lowii TaxID=190385 RepID=UPI002479FE8A|nr:uncharacterized protein LOC129754201 isoform X2 [Uranotaenia lowii]